MIITIIIISIILFFLFAPIIKTKNSKEENKETTHPKQNTQLPTSPFKSKLSSSYFPYRVDAIIFHLEAINNGLENNDLDLANLSYAKLIESIRQQNINEKNNYEDALKIIREEYEVFRKTYELEYPQQFLPPKKETKTKLTTLSATQKKDFRSYLEIENNGISDIQSFFKLSGNTDGFNREFWIAEGGESELLAKIISVYSFSIKISNFEILISKANRFLKEMKSDKMTDYWEPFPLFKIIDLKESYYFKPQTDILKKLQSLNVIERLHFFDFASFNNPGKYWDGDSSSKTRNFGIKEKDSIKKMVKLNLFSETKDIESVREIASKGELKEQAELKGFQLKKSWNLDKTYEFLMTTDKGVDFLKKYVSNRTVYKLNDIYKDDINLIIEQQTNVKVIADLLSMI